MKIKSIYIFIIALAGCFAAQASIVGYTNSFSSAASTNGWTSVGAVAPIITRTASIWDFDDGDITQMLSYTNGMTITGDGLRADGTMKVDLQNTTIKDEAIGYTLSGTFNLGETVTVTTSVLGEAAYARFYLQLWDITDNRLLTQSAQITALARSSSTATNAVPMDVSINYTATALEAGDQIQVRFLEESILVTRDIFIDNISVTAIPEPATMSLIMIGLGIPFARHFLHR